MRNYKEHLIRSGTTIRNALEVLERLSNDAILFIVNDIDKLIGSLTDGDVRRGLINGVELDQPVDDIIQLNPKFLRKGDRDIQTVISYRDSGFKIIPILNQQDKIVNVINFGKLKSYLPIDVVVMAGGKGVRLRPLTENTPKPLLTVGEKPILEHLIERLSLYGLDDIWITLNYLGKRIEDYFGCGDSRNLKINYVWEKKPLGTIGSVGNIENFIHEHILITNSDILTNLDYEDFFLRFLEEDADMAVVTIPYKVDIPYGVFEATNGKITNLKEKPTYTYYSNGGIYLLKRDIVKLIPSMTFYNTTDLIEELLKDGKKVLSYPFSGYWLDIGKKDDYSKAQIDIEKNKF